MSLPPALPRPCPSCGAAGQERLHTQRLAVPESGALLAGYDVVACASCGMAFASPLPDQAAFDAYYRDQNPYEGHDRVGSSLTDYDLRHYGYVAEQLAARVPKDARVLDVGCARGGQLEALARAGFTCLAGIDPSASCVAQARRRVQAEVRQGWVADVAKGECDLVILGSVLEHLRDVGPILAMIRQALEPGAWLYIEVPDATRFTEGLDAPFQEFSTEHINFFSPASLATLLARHGFRLVEARQPSILQTEGKWVMDLKALFQVDPGIRPEPGRDATSEAGIRSYLEASRGLDARLRTTLEDLSRRRVPLLVWGVGVHTQRLLAEGLLDAGPIVAFVDSNPRSHGTVLAGRPVLSPADLAGRQETILISSMQFERDIVRQIRTGLGLPNPLVTLYHQP